MLLRGIADTGPRCGVTTIVLRAPKTGSFTRSGQGLPDMPTIKSTAEGLVVTTRTSGTWTFAPDVPPLLALGDAAADPDALRIATSSIYERVLISTGVRAREIRRVPVTPASVFTLLGDARRRRLRDDLPRMSRADRPRGPVDLVDR